MRLNHKDQYFGHYYFPENLCNGINITSVIEQSTKKDAADLLVKLGLSSYMDALVSQYIDTSDTTTDLLRKKKLKLFAQMCANMPGKKAMIFQNSFDLVSEPGRKLLSSVTKNQNNQNGNLNEKTERGQILYTLPPRLVSTPF